MIVDSTIPIIATQQIGEAWSTVILAEIAKDRLGGATDSLMLMEILNAYWAQDAAFEGQRLYQYFRRTLKDEIKTVSVEDFDRACELAAGAPRAQPRELLHAAVALRCGDPRIFGIDGPSYDEISQVARVALPALLKELKLKGDYIEERES